MIKVENAVDTVTSGLLADVKEGDDEAWALLVEIYSPVIFVWCRQKGLNAHQSQDVGQETWASVWSNLKAFRKQQAQHSFRRWLFTIVRNKVVDMHRKLKDKTLDAPEHIQFPIEGDDDDVDKMNVNMAFSQIVQWISSKYREHNCQAFMLCYAEGVNRDEVALTLGLTRNQVDLACSRILRGLKEEFGDRTLHNE